MRFQVPKPTTRSMAPAQLRPPMAKGLPVNRFEGFRMRTRATVPKTMQVRRETKESAEEIRTVEAPAGRAGFGFWDGEGDGPLVMSIGVGVEREGDGEGEEDPGVGDSPSGLPGGSSRREGSGREGRGLAGRELSSDLGPRLRWMSACSRARRVCSAWSARRCCSS